MSRIFKIRALNAKDFKDWTFKLIRTIERSKGREFDLGIDEKNLSVKTWRVLMFNLTFLFSLIELMRKVSCAVQISATLYCSEGRTSVLK